MQYCMSEKLGPLTFGVNQEEVFLGREFNNQRNYSEKIAAEIDEEVRNIVIKGYNEAQRILNENIDKLHKTAKILLEKEKEDAAEFDEIFEGKKDISKEKNEK